jgi:hypothetical protein
VAIGLFCVGVSLPAAAQGVGAIGGTVADASGAALPGVTVALASPGVIGGAQDTVTDGRGAYQFTRLIPGTYSVRASLTGFNTSVQEGIVVYADVTARVDLRLEIATLTETVIVSGQSPLLDTTSALKQTVMTRETIDFLPARNNVWSIARNVPAVTMNKYDVGGSEMFQQSSARAHGAAGAEGAYQIDGMDIGYAGGEGGLIMYLDAHSFEEVNLQTASAPAESGRGGVVTNMVTRTGTNKFAGQYQFTGAGSGMGFSNLTSKLRADLLAAVPARARAANPNIEPSAQILGIYDNSVTLGGPIVHDRLWYSGTASEVTLNQYRLGSYNPDGTRVLDDNRMRNGQGKISWQVRPSSQLHFMYNFNNKEQHHRTGNATVDFTQSVATVHQRINTHLYQTRWTSVLPRQLLWDVSGQIMNSFERDPPQPGLPSDALATFDLITREHAGAVSAYFDRPSIRNILQTSLSFRSGSHDVKLGYHLMYRHNGDTWYALGPYAPAGIQANFRNGSPDSVNTYNTPLHFNLFSRDQAWYVQDRWAPARKLTFNIGLRLEKTYGWFPSMCQQETVFIKGQCFPAFNGAPDWLALSPRFSVIYDVAGDGRTALKVTANRYNIAVGNALLALLDPIQPTNDTRSWTDTNGDGIPQLNELGPSTGFNLGTTNRIAANLTWPFSTEYSIGLERQLPGNLVVGATYMNRRRRNEIGARNMAVPTASYIPLQVTEVNSGRQVTVYNLDPSLRGHFDVLRTNEPALHTEFNGVDLTFNKRLSHRWMLMTGLTLEKNVGDIYGAQDLNDPNLQFRRGVIEDDIPVIFKTFGLYQLPYGFSVSGSVQHFTGFAQITSVLVGAGTVPLTRVSQSITVERRGTTRLPDVNLVDLSLRKSFTVASGYSFEPVMDVFNLTNCNAIRARTTQLGPTYGQAADIVRGRLIKLGVNVKF